MKNSNIKMILTDFDGTLFRSDRAVSRRDWNTLISLGENSVTRVVATGRSYFSFSNVVSNDFPIDFLIFSSGAGIMDWKTGKILKKHSMHPDYVETMIDKLIKMNVDFFVHYPVPENHAFKYFYSGREETDFSARVALYEDYAEPLNGRAEKFGPACQFIVIIPNDEDRYFSITDELKGTHIIRSTSPLDGESIWIEIFPPEVSKSSAAEWLCKFIGIEQKTTFGIGNDYNDIDLLKWTEKSAVVSNGIPLLKNLYTVVKSNNENGFSDAVRKFAGI
ncbi:HAD family phosphatase [bacterium]|nr:HAD family phosphatase [bacterium]